MCSMCSNVVGGVSVRECACVGRGGGGGGLGGESKETEQV